MTRLMWSLVIRFFEHSEMDEERCNTAFKAISKLDNAMDEIVIKNGSQKKITYLFNNIQ